MGAGSGVGGVGWSRVHTPSHTPTRRGKSFAGPTFLLPRGPTQCRGAYPRLPHPPHHNRNTLPHNVQAFRFHFGVHCLLLFVQELPQATQDPNLPYPPPFFSSTPRVFIP